MPQPTTSSIRINLKQTISHKHHEDLVEYIVRRLRESESSRNTLVNRIMGIDQHLSGYLNPDHLTSQEQEREERLERGQALALPPQRLMLANSQLDDIVAYAMNLFAGDSTIYAALADKEQQDIASKFAALMNKHAEYFKHFSCLRRAFKDALKYNVGGFLIEWEDVYGKTVTNSELGIGVSVKDKQLTMQGNRLTPLDMYNFLWDTSATITSLADNGEFCASIRLEARHKLKRLMSMDLLFGNTDLSLSNSGTMFYRSPPAIHSPSPVHGAVQSSTNWVTALRPDMSYLELNHYVEYMTVYMWLEGKLYGLTKDTGYQLYRICLINSTHIVHLELMNNAHSCLPIAIFVPNDDAFSYVQKSCAEAIIPLQNIQSHQLNTHVEAQRKKLNGGITLFDSSVIPLDNIKAAVNGFVACNMATGAGRGLGDYVKQLSDIPDTTRTISDIAVLADLAQLILPTDQARQMAGLERSTRYQAAGVMQGANRKSWVIARAFEDQALSLAKRLQMMNIYQYQQPLEMIIEGKKQFINPAEFRESQIEFDIADGLKGIDTLAIHETIKDTVNLAVQSGGISQGIDILALLNYFTSITGDRFDLTQFRLTNPFDALTPEQKTKALALLQSQDAEAQLNQPTEEPST